MDDSDEEPRLVIDEREDSNGEDESNQEREDGEIRDDDDDDVVVDVDDDDEKGEDEDEDEDDAVMDDIDEEDEEEILIMDEDDLDEMDGEEDKEGADSASRTLRTQTESKPSTSSTSSLLLTADAFCTMASTSTASSSLLMSSSSMLPSGGDAILTTSSTSTTTMTSSISLGGAGGGAVLHGGKRMQWSIGDMLQFYEAVKQYGKDFDALHRVMAKRKMEINKDQLRNFFFNFYKQVRTGADMKEEDWPSELSRDARDLFTVINGCEWRKRMGSYKFEPARLKALIMEGTTVTRVRCKKQHVTIKTPCCPALLQFFSFNRRITRFPPDIILYLSPKTYGDGTNVMGRGASPNLCIRLNTCDRVERIFDLLHLKWKQVVARDDDDDEEEEADEDEREEREIRPFKIKLFPSRRTRMGEITFTPSPSSYCNVSLNMLHEDRSKTENIKRQIKRGSDLDEPCYQAAQSLIPLLSISRASLAAGVTRASVARASVAELYAVCGMSRSITLLYTIEDEMGDEELQQPWDILADLITRGYGEAVTERGRAGPAGVIKTPSRDEKPQQAFGMPPPSKRPRVFHPNPSGSASRASKAAPSYYVQQSPIVTAEMDEFAEQLRSMQSAPRSRKRSPVRKQTLARPSLHPLNPSVPSTPSSRSSARGGGSYFEKTENEQSPWRNDQSAASARPASRILTSAASTPGRMPSSMRTTFPQMTPTSTHHLQQLTPIKMTKMTATGNDTMALALKAALASPDCSQHEAPSTSRSGMRRMVPAAVFLSPTKTNASMPFDVRASMEQMLSQNSVNFCMEFDQLLNYTTTTIDASSSPSKLSRL